MVVLDIFESSARGDSSRKQGSREQIEEAATKKERATPAELLEDVLDGCLRHLRNLRPRGLFPQAFPLHELENHFLFYKLIKFSPGSSQQPGLKADNAAFGDFLGGGLSGGGVYLGDRLHAGIYSPPPPTPTSLTQPYPISQWPRRR